MLGVTPGLKPRKGPKEEREGGCCSSCRYLTLVLTFCSLWLRGGASDFG